MKYGISLFSVFALSSATSVATCVLAVRSIKVIVFHLGSILGYV